MILFGWLLLITASGGRCTLKTGAYTMRTTLCITGVIAGLFFSLPAHAQQGKETLCDQFRAADSAYRDLTEKSTMNELIVFSSLELINKIPRGQIGSLAAIAGASKVHYEALARLTAHWKQVSEAAEKAASLQLQIFQKNPDCK